MSFLIINSGSPDHFRLRDSASSLCLSVRVASLLLLDISRCESVFHDFRGQRSRSLAGLTKVSAAGRKQRVVPK